MTALYKQFGIVADRVADVVAYAIDQSEDTTVNEITMGLSRKSW
jgi:NADP-dependent 3-hydroxy acid dehydrogenase YdfG